MQNNPTAHIFAGANASGKTTFITHLISIGILDNKNYICPDLILREKLKLEENLENYIQAANIAENEVKRAINEKENIVLETVFSTQAKVNLLKQLKDNGYEVIVFFTSVESSDINVLYLKNRVEQGGHDVPISKLLKRREAGFENIKKSVNENSIDCLIFIDNSLMYEAPIIIKSLYKKQICFVNDDNDRELNWIDNVTNDLKLSTITTGIPQKHLDYCNLITNSLSSFSNILDKSYDEKNKILSTKDEEFNDSVANKSIKRRRY